MYISCEIANKTIPEVLVKILENYCYFSSKYFNQQYSILFLPKLRYVQNVQLNNLNCALIDFLACIICVGHFKYQN